MKLLENIRQALRAIKSNLLRTILTCLIIAFGIMALVGILTAIDSIKDSIYNNFDSVGANSFTIRETGLGVRRGMGHPENAVPITYDEAQLFKQRFTFPASISVSVRASMTSTVKHGSKKSDPNVAVLGGDDNYLINTGYELNKGRNFATDEIEGGRNVAIVGSNLVDKIYVKADTIIGSYIDIGNIRYQVVGQLKSKGSSMASSADNAVIIPLENARRFFDLSSQVSMVISVSIPSVTQLQSGIDEAGSLMRNIRRIPLGQPNDFDIVQSDSLANSLIDNISYITIAATLIGFITLFGAAIGLMNIMLVSVRERTAEIGVSKAIGATKKIIRTQFLVEAIVICQIGGILGIVLGILAGNGVSVLLGGNFIIPWFWIFMGITFCFIVGVLSGIYPAIKASQLDPIESLRYE